ncbi:hypothetical protein LIER_05435 [Lithospermum erythrorhizon]|uniref:DNA replication complex GINS protein SLD5 n=1 Tax=Lithospermum erythrorhizon TaxID=34254 RepID=A0AAV3P1V5_LITER
MDDYETRTESELLKKAWRNEKAAPEILQFEADLVERSRQLVQLMEETVVEYTSNVVDPLTVSLYQMDLDRTMYLLRSYLRTRLQKIEKYMLHIKTTPDLWKRLSIQEMEFTHESIKHMQMHLENTVLSKLPDIYQSLLQQSPISGQDVDMVPEPQLDAYVICRSKRFLGSFQLDDRWEETVNIEADDLYALPYKSIKPLVESGQIDLV